MKKILATILMTPLIAFSQPAGIRKVPLEGYCFNTNKLGEVLREYRERPVLQMNSFRYDKEGKLIAYESALLVNSETGTWTLIENFNDEGYCITAMGNSIKPVKSQTV